MIRQFLAFVFLIGLNSLILCGALSTPQSIVDVGVYTQNPFGGVTECNRDFTTVTRSFSCQRKAASAWDRFWLVDFGVSRKH